jgi:hypothetical protein
MPKNGSPSRRSMISCSTPPRLADVQRAVPLGDGLEVGRHQPLDVVADTGRQLGRVLDDEAGAAVERAPDAEGDGQRVAALDRPVGRAEQAEAMRAARRSASGGTTAACRSSPAGRTACCSVMPGSRPEQQPTHAVGGVAGGVLERRQLLDLVDHAQAVGGADQQVGRVDLLAPRRPAAHLVDEVRRQVAPSPAGEYVFQPTRPTTRATPTPSSPRISPGVASGHAAGWAG